jgi:hypothetical protein
MTEQEVKSDPAAERALEDRVSKRILCLDATEELLVRAPEDHPARPARGHCDNGGDVEVCG